MISVIIPTYNRGKLLLRALKSVLNQTYKDIEVLVVDDNSNDNTEELVQEIKDDRIRYIKLSRNGGACIARNTGIELAKGEYIAFQDSDDVWKVDKLEKQLKYLKANNLDIVSCKMNQIIDENKINIFPKNTNLKDDSIYYKNSISTQTILGKKECFLNEKFDVRLLRFQDWDLAIRLKNKYNMKIMDEILVDVYVQEDSISKNPSKAINALEVFIKKHGKNKKIIGYYSRLIGLYKMQLNKEYKKYFRKAFNCNPINKEIFFDFLVSHIGLRNFHYNFYVKRGRFK